MVRLGIFNVGNGFSVRSIAVFCCGQRHYSYAGLQTAFALIDCGSINLCCGYCSISIPRLRNFHDGAVQLKNALRHEKHLTALLSRHVLGAWPSELVCAGAARNALRRLLPQSAKGITEGFGIRFARRMPSPLTKSRTSIPQPFGSLRSLG